MTPSSLLLTGCAQSLRCLSAWLDKACEEADDADALMGLRLAPDMFPLASQVRFACFQALEPCYRLAGDPVADSAVAIRNEGAAAGETPGTFAAAQARIAETLTMLGAMDHGAMNAGAQRAVALDLPMGMIFDFESGETYVRDWALPQFYFHLNTAYAVLRHHGAPLGKVDYVAYALPCLRPGTAPGG